MFSRANPAGWVHGDKLSPAQVNQIDIEHAAAIDGINGGVYPLGGKLTLTGSGGVEIAGPVGLTIAGSGPAQWLRLAQRQVVIQHPLSIAVAVPNVGPNNNAPSGVLAPSDLAFNVNGTMAALPCVQSVGGATTQAQASYVVLELIRPPDAAVLYNVRLRTKGIASFPVTPATFTLVRWNETGYSIIGQLTVFDSHNGQNWTTTVLEQTVWASQPLATIDAAQWRYGVLVNNPYYNNPGGSSFRIYSLTAEYTVTSVRV